MDLQIDRQIDSWGVDVGFFLPQQQNKNDDDYDVFSFSLSSLATELSSNFPFSSLACKTSKLQLTQEQNIGQKNTTSTTGSLTIATNFCTGVSTLISTLLVTPFRFFLFLILPFFSLPFSFLYFFFFHCFISFPSFPSSLSFFPCIGPFSLFLYSFLCFLSLFLFFLSIPSFRLSSLMFPFLLFLPFYGFHYCRLLFLIHSIGRPSPFYY